MSFWIISAIAFVLGLCALVAVFLLLTEPKDRDDDSQPARCGTCRKRVFLLGSVVQCPDCGQWFHEECYDAIKGAGCVCHTDVAVQL